MSRRGAETRRSAHGFNECKFMKWEIFHSTRYDYLSPVRDSINNVCLQPMLNAEQTVESFMLKVLPASRLKHSHDLFLNRISRFEITEPHSYLVIDAQSRVSTHPSDPLPVTEKLCSFEDMRSGPNIEAWSDFLPASRFVGLSAEAWKLAVDATLGQEDAWLAVVALLEFVRGYLKYEPCSTHVHTHMGDVIRDRRGVCQDFAHLLIGLCRSLKIPARYISGYLATEKASATHAWVEVFIPGHGWRGLDPTNNCQTDGTYVKIGHGRDYADVPPISGNYVGTRERKMTVTVKITALE
jgi:transglutaminase-like putative cysteine protease